MDSDQLNRWLTLGANVGVLIGIVLLVYELNQNREMMRAETRSSISAQLIDIQMDISSNPQLADVVYRGWNGEDLSGGEATQFNQRNTALYRYWENVHYQYRLGLYDNSEYLRQRDAWDAYINGSKAVADHWCRIRYQFSIEFVTEVNQLLDEQQCPGE